MTFASADQTWRAVKGGVGAAWERVHRRREAQQEAMTQLIELKQLRDLLGLDPSTPVPLLFDIG